MKKEVKMKGKFIIRACVGGFGVWCIGESKDTNPLEIFRDYEQAWQWGLTQIHMGKL